MRGSDIDADNHPVTCDIGTVASGQPVPLNSVSLSLILTGYCHVAPYWTYWGKRRGVFEDPLVL